MTRAIHFFAPLAIAAMLLPGGAPAQAAAEITMGTAPAGETGGSMAMGGGSMSMDIHTGGRSMSVTMGPASPQTGGGGGGGGGGGNSPGRSFLNSSITVQSPSGIDFHRCMDALRRQPLTARQRNVRAQTCAAMR